LTLEILRKMVEMQRVERDVSKKIEQAVVSQRD